MAKPYFGYYGQAIGQRLGETPGAIASRGPITYSDVTGRSYAPTIVNPGLASFVSRRSPGQAQMEAYLSALAAQPTSTGSPGLLVENPFVQQQTQPSYEDLALDFAQSAAQATTPEEQERLSRGLFALGTQTGQYAVEPSYRDKQRLTAQQIQQVQQLEKRYSSEQQKVMDAYLRGDLPADQAQQILDQIRSNAQIHGMAVAESPLPEELVKASQNEDPVTQKANQTSQYEAYMSGGSNDLSAFLTNDPAKNSTILLNMEKGRAERIESERGPQPTPAQRYSAQRTLLKDIFKAVDNKDHEFARSLYADYQKEFGGPPPLNPQVVERAFWPDTIKQPTYEEWANLITQQPSQTRVETQKLSQQNGYMNAYTESELEEIHNQALKEGAPRRVNYNGQVVEVGPVSTP